MARSTERRDLPVPVVPVMSTTLSLGMFGPEWSMHMVTDRGRRERLVTVDMRGLQNGDDKVSSGIFFFFL